MTKTAGKRIVCVGTTTSRAIEGYFSGGWSTVNEKESRNQGIRSLACQNNNCIHGYTDIFIYPGYEFKAVTSLITNFHLPRSTPLMLVSALCGREKLRKSYEDAIRAKYRFFSYGDAMLIL
jgi:S-adenosylmethionine:tRNA ribosyltransferase-isomerase